MGKELGDSESDSDGEDEDEDKDGPLALKMHDNPLTHLQMDDDEDESLVVRESSLDIRTTTSAEL
jgi:hypothetical protein